MAGHTLHREDFDKLFLNLLPYLRGIVQASYDRTLSVIPELFNMASSGRPKEQFDVLGDLGLFDTMEDSDPYPTDAWKELYQKTYTHVQHGMAIRIGQIAAEDDLKKVLARKGPLVGASASITRETHAASLFNNGFTAGVYAGPDGVALFSASHPLEAGATDSNVGTADLDVAPLQAAITAFKQQVSHRGHYIGARPQKLLVPVGLEFTAIELLKSQLRPDTAENPINAFKEQQLTWGSWHELTDDDAWFLLGDKSDTEIHWYDRVKFTTRADRYPYNDDWMFKSRMRYSYGFNDWRKTWGSPGA